MLIEEMMNKRDLATKVAIIIQNKVGKDTCGIYNIEDFENMELGDFMNYLKDQMNTYKYHNLVFNGWVFTKDIFHKMEEFILMTCNNQYQAHQSHTYSTNFPSSRGHDYKSLHQNNNHLGYMAQGLHNVHSLRLS